MPVFWGVARKLRMVLGMTTPRRPLPRPRIQRMRRRPGSIFADRFTLLRKIGSGGMGEVWVAMDRQNETHVALKFLRRDVRLERNACARFAREAKIGRSLEHPSIVRILDAVESHGECGVVMDLLEGESLSDAFRAGRVHLGELLLIVEEIADALVTAHARGVVHRDIKPGNIFLRAPRHGEPMRAMLIDFGIARWAHVGLTRLTRAGDLLGSPHYMSPETLRKDGSQPLATDIWALGVLLFRAFTGQWPHSEKRVTSLLLAIGTRPPREIREVAPNLPRAMLQLVNDCLKPAGERLAAWEVRDRCRQLRLTSSRQILHRIAGQPEPPGRDAVPSGVTHVSSACSTEVMTWERAPCGAGARASWWRSPLVFAAALAFLVAASAVMHRGSRHEPTVARRSAAVGEAVRGWSGTRERLRDELARAKPPARTADPIGSEKNGTTRPPAVGAAIDGAASRPRAVSRRPRTRRHSKRTHRRVLRDLRM